MIQNRRRVVSDRSRSWDDRGTARLPVPDHLADRRLSVRMTALFSAALDGLKNDKVDGFSSPVPTA